MGYRDAFTNAPSEWQNRLTRLKRSWNIEIPRVASIFAAVNGQPEDRTIGQSANILPFIAGHFALTFAPPSRRRNFNSRFNARIALETKKILQKFPSPLFYLYTNEKAIIETDWNSRGMDGRTDFLRLTRNRQAYEGSNRETRPFFHAWFVSDRRELEMRDVLEKSKRFSLSLVLPSSSSSIRSNPTRKRRCSRGTRESRRTESSDRRREWSITVFWDTLSVVACTLLRS